MGRKADVHMTIPPMNHHEIIQPAEAQCNRVCHFLDTTKPALDMNLLTLAQLLVLMGWVVILKSFIYKKHQPYRSVTMYSNVFVLLTTWAEGFMLMLVLRYHGSDSSGWISLLVYAATTSLDAFSSIFIILLLCTQYPSRKWIRTTGYCAAALAALVAVCMLVATIHEGPEMQDTTTGYALYLAQDMLRLLLFGVAGLLKCRYHNRNPQKLCQLEKAGSTLDDCQQQQQPVRRSTSMSEGLPQIITDPLLLKRNSSAHIDTTNNAQSDTTNNRDFSEPERRNKRPGLLLWFVVVVFVITDFTVVAIMMISASESREKACASCVNYANQLVYFALFPAAVLYSVHRDCQYWQSITNALLSSREAQARVPCDLASLHDCLIDRDQFTISDIEVLGAGAETGPIFSASFGSKLQQCAVKQWTTEEPRELHAGSSQWEAAVSEAAMLLHAQGPQVIGMRGLCVDPPNVYLLMERAKCDLHQLLLRPELQLPQLQGACVGLPLVARVAIAAKVAEGMARLHKRDLIHRDLKAQNVLMSHDLLPLIGDFGRSRLTPGAGMPGTFDSFHGARMTAGVGTGYIRAPEVIRLVARFWLSAVSCRLSLVYTARVLMCLRLDFLCGCV